MKDEEFFVLVGKFLFKETVNVLNKYKWLNLHDNEYYRRIFF